MIREQKEKQLYKQYMVKLSVNFCKILYLQDEQKMIIDTYLEELNKLYE